MSASTVFLAFAAFVAGYVVSRYLNARSFGGSNKHFLLVYTGSTYNSYSCKPCEAGVKVGDTVYPSGSLVITQLPGYTFYFAPVEQVALANHQALEAARKTIALKALFSGGGDLMRMLQIGALVIPLLAAIWLTMSFGEVRSSLNQQSADIKLVQEQLNKPLVVQPKDTNTNASK